jgi:hypothetical protein
MPRKGNGGAASSKPRKAVATKPQAGIPRSAGASSEPASKGGALHRAAGAIKRIFQRKSTAAPVQMDVDTPSAAVPSRGRNKAGNEKAARLAKRESDIPREVLDNTYTPQLTSHKAGFRSDGADHQHDQEFASGVADERWNDEDRLTNKSGDPRIGTHKRTYEPGEARAESRGE